MPQEVLTEKELREMVVDALFPLITRQEVFAAKDIRDASKPFDQLRIVAEGRVSHDASAEDISREVKNLQYVRERVRHHMVDLAGNILRFNIDYTEASRRELQKKLTSISAENHMLSRVFDDIRDRFAEQEQTGEQTTEREDIQTLVRENLEHILIQLIDRKKYSEKDIALALMPTFDIAMQVQIDYPDEEKREKRYQQLMEIRRETIDMIDKTVSEDYGENKHTRYADRWVSYLPTLMDMVRSEVTPKKEGDEHLRGVVRK